MIRDAIYEPWVVVEARWNEIAKVLLRDGQGLQVFELDCSIDDSIRVKWINAICFNKNWIQILDQLNKIEKEEKKSITW